MKPCVIVLNYFGHSDTIDCIERLLDQDVGKIIIVENSADPSEEKTLRVFFSACPAVEVLATGNNLGFAGGVNFALKQMLPLGFQEFIILNNDTLPASDLVVKIIDSAESRSLDLASPIIFRYPEKDILWSKGNYYNRWTGMVFTRSVAFLPGDFFYLTGCCLYVHRRVFDAIGMLDESFFMYGEDVEFCHRATLKGFSLGVVEGINLYHKTGSSNHNRSLFYEYQVNRAHFLLAEKLAQADSSRKIATCSKIFFLSIRALIRSVRYRNFDAIKGYIKAINQTLSISH